MSSPEPQQQAVSEIPEEDVRKYLQSHPDFLSRHMDLLETLQVPHETGGAASLIERQVEVLRSRNGQTQQRLNDLIATARDNEWRVQHLNQLAQVLIRADSGSELVRELREFLASELDVHALYLGIAADAGELPDGIQSLPEDSDERAAVDDVFRRGHPICGPLDDTQVQAVFADSGDVRPQSAALIPLGEGEVRGVLILGSGDPERFVPHMGTLFLGLMGQLVTTACRRYVGDALI